MKRVRAAGPLRAAALRALLIVVAAAVAVPVALAHPRRPRPNLVVSMGAVSGTPARIFGSFVVANAGHAGAGRSKAKLTIRTRAGARTLATYSVGGLRPSASESIDVSVAPPKTLTAGSYPISACANSSSSVRESSYGDDCRRIGRLTVPASGPPPGGSVPTNPVPFQADTPFTLQSSLSNYWVDVPGAYDSSGRTPIELLVWLHGCGGESAGDIFTVSPASTGRYIAIAVGGREDDCWDPNTDQATVLAAIADVETHFNIDRHEVVLGGYSSGGDLAYRLAFYHSLQFAGLLAENTSPFRDTGSTASQSLAAAQWKFNVVQLAHTSDDVYPIAGVRNEVGVLQQAGFPVQLIERPGHHYDDSTATFGSDHDLQTYLLPHLNDGWRSP